MNEIENIKGDKNLRGFSKEILGRLNKCAGDPCDNCQGSGRVERRGLIYQIKKLFTNKKEMRKCKECNGSGKYGIFYLLPKYKEIKQGYRAKRR